eukprot:scaffold159019_cov34-Attheya_sp.AAC.1
MEIVNVAVLIRKRTLQLLRINDNSLERRKPGTSQLIVSWVSWVAKYRGVMRRASDGSSVVYTEPRDRRERERYNPPARSQIIVSWIAKYRGVVHVSAPTSEVPNYRVVCREISWRHACERRKMLTVVCLDRPIDTGNTGKGLAATPL